MEGGATVIQISCVRKEAIFNKRKKINGLISLGEISRHPSIDSVVLLLVITLIQVYNEEDQVGQKENKNGQLMRKRTPGNLTFYLMLVQKGTWRLRRDLICTGRLPLGHHPNHLSFQL